MLQPTTPYIWRYQPETGETAGARQDYGAVINWLHADGRMFSRIRDVNLARNAIDKGRALTTRHGLSENINNWTASELQQKPGFPYIPPTSAKLETYTDKLRTSEGEQLSGGAAVGPPYDLDDGRRYRKLTRDALPFPYNYDVFENGQWQRIHLSGTGANALSSYPTLEYISVFPPPITRYSRPGQQLQGGAAPIPVENLALLEEVSRIPHRGGMNPEQFTAEFPPVVYEEPFDGNLFYFPKEFSPLFSPEQAMLRTTDATLQYVRHS